MDSGTCTYIYKNNSSKGKRGDKCTRRVKQGNLCWEHKPKTKKREALEEKEDHTPEFIQLKNTPTSNTKKPVKKGKYFSISSSTSSTSSTSSSSSLSSSDSSDSESS
jgi:hypothetical protein